MSAASWALMWGGLFSCATLPEYARPVGEVRRASAAPSTDTIPYRELTRGDFLGTSPHPRVATHGDKLGALTCASMTPRSQTLSPQVQPDQAGGFIAHAPAMGYRGMMDRACSWWNPKPSGASVEYVLQHEQIHFAIIELEARRLNVELAEVEGRGDTPQAAAEALERAIRVVVTESVDRALQRSREFDNDTSLSHDAEAQSRWAGQIQAELGLPH